jgi:hypothetical protein
VVAHAQEQGLVTIAFRANNGEHKCWSDFPPERRSNADVVRVMDSLAAFMEQHHWTNMPVYGLGASSGGSFVRCGPRVQTSSSSSSDFRISLLSRYYKFKAITIIKRLTY